MFYNDALSAGFSLWYLSIKYFEYIILYKV
jgi:hypothetical protein